MLRKNKPATQDFQFVGGNLALDFLNTVGNRLTERRDYFITSSDVARWARLAGLIGSAKMLSLTTVQLNSLRSVRENLYALFKQIQNGATPSESELGWLNRMLAGHLSRRYMKSVDGRRLRWFWKDGQPDLACILGPVLSSAADLMVSEDIAVLRQCQDEACGWLFLDRSQAHRRRWCSMADCGNRAKARRFYSETARS